MKWKLLVSLQPEVMLNNGLLGPTDERMFERPQDVQEYKYDLTEGGGRRELEYCSTLLCLAILRQQHACIS